MPEKLVYSEDVFTVLGLLTPEECSAYIEQSERQGYDAAPINTLFGPAVVPEVRNNQRVMVDAPEVAEALWMRAREFAPAKWEGWEVVGLNERLRLYRYDVGQMFDWHRDGYFERPTGERSLFTFMIYLNEDFDGGETLFAPWESAAGWNGLTIKPQTGMALFFEHLKLHKGEAVARGRKYVLRTDVMFRRV